MPNRPAKYCALAHSGRCKPSNIVPAGQTYCEYHQKQVSKAKDSGRETATARGYNTRWRKVRTTYLHTHPLCIHCKEQGRIRQATVVDHIVPHGGDQELFWDQDNWQPLCKPCHDKKTAKEDGGFGNRGKTHSHRRMTMADRVAMGDKVEVRKFF